MSRTRHPQHLVALARACGIELEFRDGLGEVRRASVETLRRLLMALGHGAEDEASAKRSLQRVREVAIDNEARPSRRMSCHRPESTATGLLLNLYTLRSSSDRGFGDFAALEECVRRAARTGFDFVGVNPLHALRNTRSDSSPYYPVSRLFRSELYLDANALPEADSPSVQRTMASASMRRSTRKQSAADELDYDALAKQQRTVLNAAYEVFRRSSTRSARWRAFQSFVARKGAELDGFATFMAIEERYGRDRSRWRRGLANRDPSAVARFRADYPDPIQFHRFVQFELERQWLAIGALANRSGMRIGLYSDLAIGSAPDSADVWMDPDSFVTGFSLGAPPDGYARQGQVWNFPPLNPAALVDADAKRFRALLRAAMLGAGAVRIDHAIGLVRQYWIPEGEPGTNGVMVRMPATRLFEVIAEESRRQRCIVIGEDLGTLPKELPGLLDRYGLLSSRVLWFSRRRNGSFQDPRRFPRRSLATFGTHDLPPFLGFASGADLALRTQLSLLPKSRLAAARREREHELDALRRRVNATLEAQRDTPLSIGAVHAALEQAASALVGFALDDIAGETQPVNVPGITSDRHPVWSRRMALPLDRIEWPRPIRGKRARGRR